MSTEIGEHPFIKTIIKPNDPIETLSELLRWLRIEYDTFPIVQRNLAVPNSDFIRNTLPFVFHLEFGDSRFVLGIEQLSLVFVLELKT